MFLHKNCRVTTPTLKPLVLVGRPRQQLKKIVIALNNAALGIYVVKEGFGIVPGCSFSVFSKLENDDFGVIEVYSVVRKQLDCLMQVLP